MLGPPDGVENFVLVHVSSVLVMVTMAEFPLIERYHQESVADRSDDIVEQRVVGERAVTGVVSGYEEGKEECALNGPVEQRKRDAQR